MSRKIKANILKPHNLQGVSTNSRLVLSVSNSPSVMFSSCHNQRQEPHLFRLKSLSEQRNIAKTLKRIDSPDHSNSKFSLFDPHGSIKPQIIETLESIEEQLQSRSRSKTHRRRDSASDIRKKGIPYSKIRLGAIRLNGKENIRPAGSSNESTFTKSRPHPTISSKVCLRRGINLTSNQTQTLSSKLSHPKHSKQSSLQSSICKRKGIQLIQHRHII